MGRMLKRVPLDFDYPINKVWEGYINPYKNSCEGCNRGSSVGYSFDGEYIEQAVKKFLGTPELRESKMFRKIIQKLIEPSELLERENNSHVSSTMAYAAMVNLGKIAGLEDGWIGCQNPTCKEEREKFHSFKETEPPNGKGYQLWENTTQGSPQSPVFETLEELTVWCAENANIFANEKATKEEWLKMLL